MIMTSEKGLSVLDAVALYKELTDVESGFRQLKDVLAMRPIYHQIELRVKAHIFVAALGVAGPTTSGPTAQRGGSRSVPGAGDAGSVDSAASTTLSTELWFVRFVVRA